MFGTNEFSEIATKAIEAIEKLIVEEWMYSDTEDVKNTLAFQNATTELHAAVAEVFMSASDAEMVHQDTAADCIEEALKMLFTQSELMAGYTLNTLNDWLDECRDEFLSRHFYLARMTLS